MTPRKEGSICKPSYLPHCEYFHLSDDEFGAIREMFAFESPEYSLSRYHLGFFTIWVFTVSKMSSNFSKNFTMEASVIQMERFSLLNENDPFKIGRRQHAVRCGTSDESGAQLYGSESGGVENDSREEGLGCVGSSEAASP